MRKYGIILIQRKNGGTVPQTALGKPSVQELRYTDLYQFVSKDKK